MASTRTVGCTGQGQILENKRLREHPPSGEPLPVFNMGVRRGRRGTPTGMSGTPSGWRKPRGCALPGPGHHPTPSGDRLREGLGLGRLNTTGDRKGQAGLVPEWAGLGLGLVPTSEREIVPFLRSPTPGRLLESTGDFE